MIKYKIIDNFLNLSDFAKLTSDILPIEVGAPKTNNFSWEYVNGLVPEGYIEEDRFKKVTNIELVNPIYNWFFIHLFQVRGYQNQTLQLLGELINKIDVLGIHRIHAGFTVQQEKGGRSPFHKDYPDIFKHTSMVTSIFYVNTTNGPTLLEDGTEIECRANRLVSFPYETQHAAVLCTDQPYRVVINLNYFKDLELP